MRLLNLPLKNVTGNWWRAITLGTFVLLSSIILLVFNAFSMTVTDNMENALINALTGHVQIRSLHAGEEDMFTISTSWSGLDVLGAEDTHQIRDELAGLGYDYVVRTRHNAQLEFAGQQAFAMVIGFDLSKNYYQRAFDLAAGTFPQQPGEILLSLYHAEELGVQVGDEIHVTGSGGTTTLAVAGIGNVEMLSLFGFYAAYTDQDSARAVAGLDAGEATDVIVYGQSRSDAVAMSENIAEKLEGYAISVWGDMGGFVLDGISVYKAMFVVFIIILMLIVSILIINLVSMMGLERRQEIGTLKALGFGRGRIVSLFLGEILAIAVVFCVLGLALGSALVLAFTNVGFEVGPPINFALGNVFYIRYDVSLLFPVACVVIVFTMAAALWPSWQAAALNPVDAMKE